MAGSMAISATRDRAVAPAGSFFRCRRAGGGVSQRIRSTRMGRLGPRTQHGGDVMRLFTVTALTPRRLRRIVLAATGLAVGAAAVATASPETRCQGSRYDAAGIYVRCQLKATGKYLAAGSVDVPKYQERAGQCAEVYSRMLVRLQGRAKGTGSTCDGAQLVDNGDGTVTDQLTGL